MMADSKLDDAADRAMLDSVRRGGPERGSLSRRTPPIPKLQFTSAGGGSDTTSEHSSHSDRSNRSGSETEKQPRSVERGSLSRKSPLIPPLKLAGSPAGGPQPALGNPSVLLISPQKQPEVGDSCVVPVFFRSASLCNNHSRLIEVIFQSNDVYRSLSNGG